jgi:hypothetical protein
MSPVGFEPKISAGERPQTYALDRAATGIGVVLKLIKKYYSQGKSEQWRWQRPNVCVIQWVNYCMGIKRVKYHCSLVFFYIIA